MPGNSLMSPVPRILICDKLEPDGLAVLKQADLQVDNRPGLKGEELQAALQAADGAIIRLATRITADLLEDPGKLRIIVRAGAGVDNIDVVAATRKGVIVMNTPSSNTLSACEHTWGLILAVARQIPTADSVMHQGGWDRHKFLGMQLAGKTLGIIGLGRIGREVAKRALPMGMKVLGYDPIMTIDQMTALGVTSAYNIEAVLQQADIVTLHVPLNAETNGLIDKPQLSKMKQGAFLINCARGGIIDESALVEALRSGHLGGAALDVFAQEPLPADHPLRALPNVVLTPHLGAATREAQRSVAVEAAETMVDFFKRDSGQFFFDVEPAPQQIKTLKPGLDAARRLGLLVSQIQEGTITRIHLSFQGELPALGMNWLSSAFAVGLLETRLSERLTPINAALLAKERGIYIVQTHDPARGDYPSLLSLEIETSQGAHTVAAACFGNDEPRLVQFDGYRLDAPLAGNLLIIASRNAPDSMEIFFHVLASQSVKIVNVAAGQSDKGEGWIAVVNLLNPGSDPLVAKLQSQKDIRLVHLIQLPAAGAVPVWLR
jgi:D-3-phosphoglycerate dehydrogenase